MALHAVGHVRHLFTHGRWRGWLTVSTRKQRNIAVLFGQFANCVNHVANFRQDHRVTRFFEHQRM
ncbi:Uncharacterised protein [Vibrio cholerae]|nr:Uncharacterised protein [Vibrio cholerae]CSI74685.1 Uncharacterised protein [Vibrio cholerae]